MKYCQEINILISLTFCRFEAGEYQFSLTVTISNAEIDRQHNNISLIFTEKRLKTPTLTLK